MRLFGETHRTDSIKDLAVLMPASGIELQAARREAAREFDDKYRTAASYASRNLQTYHEYFDGFLHRPFAADLKKLPCTAAETSGGHIVILDIGCAHGQPLHEAVEKISTQTTATVEGIGITLTPFWHPHIPLPSEQYRVADIFEGLPVESGSVNLALSAAGPQPRDLHEFDTWRSELRRVMQPGGVLYYQVDSITADALSATHNPFGTAAEWRLYRTVRHDISHTILRAEFSPEFDVVTGS